MGEEMSEAENLSNEIDGEETTVFEIGLHCSAGEWPQSCKGVMPVAVALQHCLEAATKGNPGAFEEAMHTADDALRSWYIELFGVKELTDWEEV